MLDLDKMGIKSAVVIDSSSKIESALEDAHKAFLERKGGDPLVASHTQLLRGADDGLVVMKHAPGVSLIKSSFDQNVLRTLASKRGLKDADFKPERVKSYYASDERPDRHGDIVEQSWNFKDYESNPLFLYGHGWTMPPIGKSLDWNVVNRADGKYAGDALKIDCYFAEKETYPFADTIFRLVDGGFLVTGSIGARPGQVISISDPNERKKLGLGPTGHILRDSGLIEFSTVGVPANPGAHTILNSMKSAGRLEHADIYVIRELVRRDLEQTGDEKEWSKRDKDMMMLWKHLFPDKALGEHKDLSETLLWHFAEAQEEAATKLANALALSETGQNKPNSGENGGAGSAADGQNGENLVEGSAALKELRELHESVTRLAERQEEQNVILSDIRLHLENSGDDAAKRGGAGGNRQVTVMERILLQAGDD